MAAIISSTPTVSSALIDEVIRGLEEHHTYDKILAEKIQMAIKVIQDIGKVRLASARLSCLDLISRMTIHFSNEKEQMIDLFRELLEKDSIVEINSDGIDELAKGLAKIVNQCTGIKLLCKINDCFASVIELYLEHLAAGHFTPMLASEKEELTAAQSLLNKRNKVLKLSKHAKTNLPLKYTLRLLREGIRRIKTEEDLDAFQETFGNVVKIADRVVNKDFEGAVTETMVLANRHINNLTSSWYEDLLLYKRLSRDAVTDERKLVTLLVMISKTDAKDWHLTYGGIEALYKIAYESSDHRIRSLAICGDPEKGLTGIVNFLSFEKFEHIARRSKNIFRTIEKGKIYDQRVQECAYRCVNDLFKLKRSTIQPLFSEYFSSRTASLSFIKWWTPFATQIRLENEERARAEIERQREQQEMQAQEEMRKLELDAAVKPVAIFKEHITEIRLPRIDEKAALEVLFTVRKGREERQKARKTRIVQLAQKIIN